MPEREISEDVWVLVAQELDAPDLFSFCRCSTEFLRIVRPVLYRKVTLKHTRWHRKDCDFAVTDTTLQLLISNPSLSNNVRHLKVVLDQTEFPMVGLTEAILAMNFLVSFEIIGPRSFLFRNAEEQRDFVKKFKARNVVLPEIHLTCGFYPSEPLDISGLIRVGWRNEPSGCFLSLLSASSTTITELHFDFIEIAHQQHLGEAGFWSLRFPRLRLFILRWEWRYMHGFSLASAAPRREFFIAHAKTLDRIQLPDSAALAFSGTEVKGVNDQPCLGIRYLEGSSYFYEMIARRMGHSLHGDISCVTLHEFCPRTSDMENRPFRRSILLQLERLVDFFWLRTRYPNGNAFPRPPFVSGVVEVSIPWMSTDQPFSKGKWDEFSPPPWDGDDLGPFLQLLRHFSKVFGPPLRILSGRIPPIPGLNTQLLGTALKQFPRLETAHVCEELVLESGCKDMEECALQLVERCDTLKSVIFVLSGFQGVSIQIEKSQHSALPWVLRRRYVELHPNSLRIVPSYSSEET